MEIYHKGKAIRAKGPSGNIKWTVYNNLYVVILYIFLLVLQTNCQTVVKDDTSLNTSVDTLTKRNQNIVNNVDIKNNCHSCDTSNNNKINENTIKFATENGDKNEEESRSGNKSFLEDLITTVNTFTNKYLINNRTEQELEIKVEKLLDEALSKDRYEIAEGIEIKTIESNQKNESLNERENEFIDNKGRALFSKYTYEYRLFQKIKNFVDTHILSINLPKAANLIGFRSFGLKKFFVPLLIGAQVFKSILLAMFLPSILGSFGKILGKGISQLSASSSQASYPPANVDAHDAYNADNKDIMGYETDPAGSYTYPDGLYGNMGDPGEVNSLANVDLSRFGMGGQKVSYLPSSNSYYKNQISGSNNNYKVFQKIPASSMILSNYDPFYSPLLSRLDGIFARLGLTPSESSLDSVQVGGQTVSDIKLESCREQLICLMYASPAKYAPYSNLVSAQLSRELNELRRPVSDNPEILRFFRYMRAARRGQDGTDCVRSHAACAAHTVPAHTMIAAYNDINKLVTARKL